MPTLEAWPQSAPLIINPSFGKEEGKCVVDVRRLSMEENCKIQGDEPDSLLTSSPLPATCGTFSQGILLFPFQEKRQEDPLNQHCVLGVSTVPGTKERT